MHDWTASLEPGRASHLCIIAWPVKLALHRRFGLLVQDRPNGPSLNEPKVSAGGA